MVALLLVLCWCCCRLLPDWHWFFPRVIFSVKRKRENIATREIRKHTFAHFVRGLALGWEINRGQQLSQSDSASIFLSISRGSEAPARVSTPGWLSLQKRGWTRSNSKVMKWWQLRILRPQREPEIFLPFFSGSRCNLKSCHHHDEDPIHFRLYDAVLCILLGDFVALALMSSLPLNWMKHKSGGCIKREQNFVVKIDFFKWERPSVPAMHVCILIFPLVSSHLQFTLDECVL